MAMSNTMVPKQVVLLLLYCFTNILFTSAKCHNESIISYYENLIVRETTRASSCQIPENSYDFKIKNEMVEDFGKYDYIIVGAGSAGAVIASRLSEIPEMKILLLEAGGEETDFTDIPSQAFFTRCIKDFNWGYKSVPQTTCCQGFVEKKCPYPRGKSIGGTSTISALIHVRGHRSDFNSWGKDWSYDKVLPYFKKSEYFDYFEADEDYRGKNGQLQVSYHQQNSIMTDAFIESNLQLGEKYIDYNGKEQLGVSHTQFNVLRGKRQSTGRAFLDKARSRKNLTVLTQALVTKILIEARNKAAYGILFSYKGKLFKATSNQEVIVSAGAINSPQLLMLSGIGPAKHLKSKGIRVINNLAVGDNLRDHVAYYGIHIETNYIEPAKSVRENIEEYLEGFGPFTIGYNAQALGFYQVEHFDPQGAPEMELIFLTGNNTGELIQKQYGLTDETFQAHWGKSETSLVLRLVLLHPKSIGNIRLKSKSPYEHPLIDPRFLSNPSDMESLYKVIQKTLKIIQAPAFQAFNASLLNSPLPACSAYEYMSKDYWFCSMKQLSHHVYNPIGTCKLGSDTNEGAVVDSKLRVHGIKNLRVADASIIPTTTSGHTNAVAIMIGERLADLIKEANLQNKLKK